ncbi:MAG: hypothetical protein V4787_10325 [Pseudomonadota bacterium]
MAHLGAPIITNHNSLAVPTAQAVPVGLAHLLQGGLTPAQIEEPLVRQFVESGEWAFGRTGMGRSLDTAHSAATFCANWCMEHGQPGLLREVLQMHAAHCGPFMDRKLEPVMLGPVTQPAHLATLCNAAPGCTGYARTQIAINLDVLGSQDVELLVAAIRQNPEMCNFSVSGTMHAEVLFGALAGLPQFTLECIVPSNWPSRSVKKLSDNVKSLLEASTSMKEFSLKEKTGPTFRMCEPDDMLGIATGLAKQTSLTTATFFVTAYCMRGVCHLLTSCPTLGKLTLCIGGEADELVQALRHPDCSVTAMDLTLQTEGAANSLIAALAGNRKIVDLKLHGTGLEPVLVWNLIAKNKHLESFQLSGTVASGEPVEGMFQDAITRMVRFNKEQELKYSHGTLVAALQAHDGEKELRTMLPLPDDVTHSIAGQWTTRQDRRAAGAIILVDKLRYGAASQAQMRENGERLMRLLDGAEYGEPGQVLPSRGEFGKAFMQLLEQGIEVSAEDIRRVAQDPGMVAQIFKGPIEVFPLLVQALVDAGVDPGPLAPTLFAALNPSSFMTKIRMGKEEGKIKPQSPYSTLNNLSALKAQWKNVPSPQYFELVARLHENCMGEQTRANPIWRAALNKAVAMDVNDLANAVMAAVIQRNGGAVHGLIQGAIGSFPQLAAIIVGSADFQHARYILLETMSAGLATLPAAAVAKLFDGLHAMSESRTEAEAVFANQALLDFKNHFKGMSAQRREEIAAADPDNLNLVTFISDSGEAGGTLWQSVSDWWFGGKPKS